MDVFKLWIDHGKRLSNAGYSYIVIPSVTEPELTGTNTGRSIEVLANNKDIQAVKHTGLNVCQIVFYKAGKISVTPDITISMDSSGLIMVRTEEKGIKEISVSDPSRRLGKIHFSVSVRIDKKGSDFKAIWDEAEGFTEISVGLPQGVYAGRSVTVIL